MSLLVFGLLLVFWFTNMYFSPTNSLTIELIRASYTISVFYLGQRLGRQREEEKSQKEKRDLRTYVYTILEFLENPYKEQIENLNYLVDQMRTFDNVDFVFPQVSSFNFKSIKQQNDTNLFAAFVFNLDGDRYEKTKSFAIFKTSVEYYDKVIDQTLPELFNAFIDKLTTINKEYMYYAKPIESQFQRLLVEAINESKSDDVTQKFVKIAEENQIATVSHSGLKNAGFFFDHIIQPLLEVCNEYLGDVRCQSMINGLSNCKTSFESMEQHKVHFSGILEQLIGDMEEQKVKLATAISYFKYLDKENK